MKDPLMKIYGFFEVEDTEQAEKCVFALHTLCEEWYLNTDIFIVEDTMIHISYEGDYFPHEETAEILATYITEKSLGKMDVIDLEAWTLQRFFLDKEHNKELLTEHPTDREKNKLLPYSRKSSLNHALEASQEKNGNTYFKTSS